MKKSLLIILAFITSFLLNEIIVKYIIGYPVYGLYKNVFGMRSKQVGGGIGSLWLPYSEYWNVEGGNIVEQRNNLGLPGLDVLINDSSKVIFLLGSSYLASFEVKKKEMASSVFQNMMKAYNNNYEIVNLACPGYDPYDLYFRIKYFEKHFQDKFKPDYVFLVLEDDKMDWIKRNKIIDFSIDSNSGKGIERPGNLYKFVKYFRNASSTLNLYFYAVKDAPFLSTPVVRPQDVKDNLALIQKQNDNTYFLLDTILFEYKESYGTKFILFSISSDEIFNLHLKEFCKKENIIFFQKKLLKPDSRFISHLNTKGNYELGNFLFESFIKFIKND